MSPPYYLKTTYSFSDAVRFQRWALETCAQNGFPVQECKLSSELDDDGAIVWRVLVRAYQKSEVASSQANWPDNAATS